MSKSNTAMERGKIILSPNCQEMVIPLTSGAVYRIVVNHNGNLVMSKEQNRNKYDVATEIISKVDLEYSINIS